ncbi:uncharacterized protein SOCE26_029820 [Sorangium cellulosum]|uniref:Peptidase C51 domain-containing protein n=1 Tax=Sorangium cellulosum TaxID=56 RepID=A0A2L0EQH8_SORCE|nr:hypothetical protein [Sorangium cellulosum]AUX41561.1 uncharacterized protein SOCE26_029820 [Sorangium cellulosum]
MLSNTARFLMASAAASLVALGSAHANAQTCGDISDAALDIVPGGTFVGTGATFFTQAVKDAFGYTSTDIHFLWGSTSPNSAKYYDHVVAGTYFQQITNILDIAPGDVIVVDATATYSGHTMIVREVEAWEGPVKEILPAMNPVFASTRQWAVGIVDSTTSVHGCGSAYPDSRWSGNCTAGTFTAGPGTAFTRLYTDPAGVIQGHSWSVTSGATYYSPTTRPLAVGRVTPCPPIIPPAI